MTVRPGEGDVYTHERTFTRGDVRRFADLSGDRQPRHLEPDDEGRLLVHGLLTATLPTKVGGDLEVLARTMEFEFRRPVYTGETVTCRVELEAVEERADRYEVDASAVCRNGDGERVLAARFEGIVRK